MAAFAYNYLEDWLLNPPHQGGDYDFEQYMDELEAQQELPFHQGDLWQQAFIPTLLKFLGTQNDPWNWLGDAFLSLLPNIWSTIYDKPSWPDEDNALVCTFMSFVSLAGYGHKLGIS